MLIYFQVFNLALYIQGQGGSMLGTKVALVKSIYISGNKIFLVRIEKLIGALKKLKLPLKVSESFENQTNEKRDDGVLIIELLEPLDDIKTACLRITNEYSPDEAIVQRFKLSSFSNGSHILAITFSLTHKEFDSILKEEVEKIIGRALAY